MSEEPKLYTNKPKKAQLKRYQQQQASAPSSMASSGPSTGSQAAMTPPPPPPPPPSPHPPKESFARRYKFIWPLLLAVNLTVGAYFVMRTKKKDVYTEEAESHDLPTAPVSTSAAGATVTEKSHSPTPVMEPAKLRAPIPEDQQRELFRWMLEERRKVKPKDREEKKRIDEEKAILKQFIRAKSIPSL
ncbi:unnamed protein product [Fraxinus pennsylvanica]|uniref:Uncharacterized protein n=1 Tax=Fraxinus pennsylvanica TaxID=56036 RepID=A0AAD1ZQ41_9LAMI|nr:unnamed protein product [Fraxinus pennsylvanica]